MENTKTLGDLLPADQAALLSSEVKKLSQKDLEAALDNIGGSDLTVKELDSLRALSLSRINNGDSPFTYTKHNFSTASVNDQDPNTCSCW